MKDFSGNIYVQETVSVLCFPSLTIQTLSRPILDLWECLMEDLTNYSRSQLSTAYTIEKEIKPGLVAFSEVEMVKQVSVSQGPTESSKQLTRARYLGHVTGYKPIRNQYLLAQSVPKVCAALRVL